MNFEDRAFLLNLNSELLERVNIQRPNQEPLSVIASTKRRLSKDEWLKIEDLCLRRKLPVAIYVNGLFGGHISLKMYEQNDSTGTANGLVEVLEVYFENMPIVDDDFMLLDERGRMHNAYCSWLELLKSESNIAMIEKYNLPPTRDFDWYVDWD